MEHRVRNALQNWVHRNRIRERADEVPTGRGSQVGWRELAVWVAQWELADVEIAGELGHLRH